MGCTLRVKSRCHFCLQQNVVLRTTVLLTAKFVEGQNLSLWKGCPGHHDFSWAESLKVLELEAESEKNWLFRIDCAVKINENRFKLVSSLVSSWMDLAANLARIKTQQCHSAAINVPFSSGEWLWDPTYEASHCISLHRIGRPEWRLMRILDLGNWWKLEAVESLGIHLWVRLRKCPLPCSKS